MAQDNPNEKTAHYANPRYDFMARQAMMHMNEHFRFGQLRRHYMQTRQFDPVGEAITDEMLALSYKAQNTNDTAQINSLLVRYRALVMDHLGNLQVVLQALSLSKLDRRFGNPKFFSWMRDGLVNDVLISGDGKTLRGAYDIITVAEETVLLNKLGVRVLDTQERHEGAVYYTMHEVEDLRSGQKYTVFVNTSFAMKFLESQRTGKTQSIDLRRQ